jgi:transcriptional regulator with XRE-family HTH domain
MTQAELARRMGTTQSAIARLERPGSNPRFNTLSRALSLTGRQLELTTGPAQSSIDESLTRDRVRLSPADRLASFESSYANVRKLVLTAKPLRG